MGYHKIFNLHGINYNSIKDPSSSRQDLLKGVGKRSKLTLEEFSYDGKPALMVINGYNNLDVGVVPADDVEKILPHLDKPYDLFYIEKYYFDDEKCGLKLQFYSYTEEELKEMEEERRRAEQIKAEKRARPIYMHWYFYVAMFFIIVMAIMIITGDFGERINV